MRLNTYFDFAENDFLYFMNSAERGDVANMMGAIAQGICEKYMKHLISEFDHPESASGVEAKEKVLKAHSLTKLLKYIDRNLDFEFSKDAKADMKVIDGFYFSTRYPGDESIEVDEIDIENCISAVQICRRETIQFLEFEKQKSQLDKDIDKAAKASKEQVGIHDDKQKVVRDDEQR